MQISPSVHHRTTLSGYIFATKARIDNRKNLLSSNISPTCPYNMVNFGLLVAEITSLVSGIPANFNGFRVLAALLHSQTAALNRGRHLYSRGRPSRWALAHISSILWPTHTNHKTWRMANPVSCTCGSMHISHTTWTLLILSIWISRLFTTLSGLQTKKLRFLLLYLPENVTMLMCLCGWLNSTVFVYFSDYWQLLQQSWHLKTQASYVIQLHFAWVVDDAKCIVVTRVCLSVCVSVRGRTPTLLHGPGCNLAAW